MIPSPTTLQNDVLMLISVFTSIAYANVVTHVANKNQPKLPSKAKIIK